MRNIRVHISGEPGARILTLTIDLDAKGEKSNSGKSVIIASTGGNVPVDQRTPDVRLGLNLYRKV